MHDKDIGLTAMDPKSDQAMEYYTNHFFAPEKVESKCVLYILKQYVQNDFQASRKEFRQFVDGSAAIRNVKPVSLYSILNYYIIDHWEEYAGNWRRYLGWEGKFSPGVITGLRLFCQSYPAFFRIP